MKTVFLMRHGDYEPLIDDFTATGTRILLKSAHDLHTELHRLGISHPVVHHSPLRRAHLTAQRVSERLRATLHVERGLSVESSIAAFKEVLERAPHGAVIVTHDVLLAPYLRIPEETFAKGTYRKITL
jgi:phosphohistidine phosphatase SixA